MGQQLTQAAQPADEVQRGDRLMTPAAGCMQLMTHHTESSVKPELHAIPRKARLIKEQAGKFCGRADRGRLTGPTCDSLLY
jgi:hypothetical protein